ncbi:site-2 protease family protein [Rugosimonospora acidiphila]|uniref:Site-2 protease family protein n=1 Tax=Rugosimonospora acidiphila TaxID=556531 RepID=A0ABP9RQR9_9ACTN
MTYRSGRRLAIGVPRGASRPSPLFLCILAVFVITAWTTWSGYGSVRLNVFLFVVAGWLLSLCLHEFAHALTAYRSGDASVAQKGYLSLNPLKYTHWLLSLALPLFFLIVGGIGLPGGAVWIDRTWIRGRLKDSLISLAGPATNMLFTAVLVLPFAFGVNTFAHPDFWSAWAFLAFLQLMASLLNLVPIPGVDGGNALRPWLSHDWRRGFDAVAPYGMLLFLALLWQPRINAIFFDVVDGLANLIGLPLDFADFGRSLFMFWQSW